jgi:mono/diheme cytochrome c family protein
MALAEKTPLADPRDEAQVARGQAVYKEQCAACHGANLDGHPDWKQRLPNGRMPPPPHDATGHTWHHPDDLLFGMIQRGVAAYAWKGYESDMPAFGNVLSEDAIWAVLDYIKSTWPDDYGSHSRLAAHSAPFGRTHVSQARRDLSGRRY